MSVQQRRAVFAGGFEACLRLTRVSDKRGFFETVKLGDTEGVQLALHSNPVRQQGVGYTDSSWIRSLSVSDQEFRWDLVDMERM